MSKSILVVKGLSVLWVAILPGSDIEAVEEQMLELARPDSSQNPNL